MSNRYPLGKSKATGALLLAAALSLFCVDARAATWAINVEVDLGKSQAGNVGCGFGLIKDEANTLTIKLAYTKGTIVKSEVVAPDPNLLWKQDSQKQWTVTGLAPNKKFWCIIKVTVKPGGGGAGVGGLKERWMSVSDVDLDGDTDNDSDANHRPPEESDAEDLWEYPTTTGPTAGTIGLLIPLNDDNDISWDNRDSKKYMGMYAADNEILDLELKISAKKAGKTTYLNSDAYWYDDGNVEVFDAGFDHTVPAGDYELPSHIEAKGSASSGSSWYMYVEFDPDIPQDGVDPEDRIKYLLIGTDIDVDSDNNGAISNDPHQPNQGEDFFEKHPASELTVDPEFKNGMLVAINDDSDDGDNDPDNGWNGTDWTGPESQIVVAGEDDLKPLILRALKLGLTKQLLMEDLDPQILLTQIGGTGALRIFTTGANPQVVWDNTSASGYQNELPDGTSFWEALRGSTDLDLQVEGLTPGEVILEVSLRIHFPDGPDIHKDTVRITVCGLDLDVNHDGDVKDPVDGIYGYLPGMEGTTARITYSTAGATVVYTAGQQMNLIATAGPNITSVEFRITASSDEPGFCMNSSDSPNTNNDDYSFAAATEDPGPKTVTASGGSASQGFYCKDFGGYCTVRAVFKTGTTEVLTIERPIPRDGNGNRVADIYAGDIGPGVSAAATDDAETIPAGEAGANGDELSRYQEYRGFIVNTNHRRTNPERKDVFVRDVDNLGAGDFTTGTLGADVWYIRANEWVVASRRINARNETAHVDNYEAIRVTDGGVAPDGQWGQTWGDTVTNPFEPNVPNNQTSCELYMTTVRAFPASLSANINATVVTIPVNFVNAVAATAWATAGQIRIDNEIIAYTGRTANSFTGCTRGVGGTVAAPHNNGANIPNWTDVDDFVERLFAHECGHLVGLEDRANNNSIMTEPAPRGGVSGTHYWHVFGTDLNGQFRVID